MCFLMNIINIYYLSVEYFRFDVTSDVRISVPEIIEIPSFTFCFDIADLINWENLTRSQKEKLLTNTGINSDSNFSQTAFTELIRLRILQNIIVEYNSSGIIDITHDYRTVIGYWEFTRLLISKYGSSDFPPDIRNTSLFAHELPFQLKDVYLTGIKKCFVLQPSEKVAKIIDYQQLTTLSSESNVLIVWSIKHLGDEIFCDITHKDIFLLSSDTSIMVPSGRYISLTYDTYTARLLEKPYSTKCRKYSVSGFISRAHCRHECYKRRLIQNFNIIFERLRSYSFDSAFRGFSSDFIKRPSQEYVVYESCDKQCKDIDCYSVTYISRLLSRDYGTKRKNMSRISISISKYPVTVTETHPAILFTIFLTNVFSTFGFWLGFSVLGSFSLFKNVAFYLNRVNIHQRSLQNGTHNEIHRERSTRNIR